MRAGTIPFRIGTRRFGLQRDSAMDSGHGNGSSKNSSAEAESILNSDQFQPIISFVDFEHDGRSTTDSESTIKEVTPDGRENSRSPHSAASSSSDSTAADFFQLKPIIIPNSNNSNPKSSRKSEGNAKLHRRDDKSEVSITALFSLEKIYGSSGSISQVSDVTHESLLPTLSQTQSPPVQVMERPGGYDPNRIPASVFTSKSSTPMEWSANSNESLFSIQIGNSLARDQFAITGGDSPNSAESNIPEESYKSKKLYKSGELSRSNELHSSGVVKIPDEIAVLGPTSPVTKVKEENPQNLDLGKNRLILTDQVKNIPYGSNNVEDKANQEGLKDKNAIRHSDENGANILSSAFRIKRKSSKSICLCSNCGWGCCGFKRPRWSCKWLCSPSFCCKWPSWSCCCSKWPSSCFKCHCSNYSWAFCCTWKNTKKIFCCSSSKASKDGRRRKWCSCTCCCPCCSSCSCSC